MHYAHQFSFQAFQHILLHGSGRNGEPKQVENVASGDVTPRSVPASFEVKPLKKWYIACSFVNLLIGGNTPNASAVKKTIVFG